MKKFLAIILTIIFSFQLAGCSKSENEKKPEPNPISDFEYTVGTKSATITRYIGKSKTVVIPEEIEGKPVTVISSCKNEVLESVTIPSTVKMIQLCAFAGCTTLKEVNFGDSLEIIDVEAFYGCTSLTEVKLPKNLKTLGGSAFKKCTSLKNVFIPKSVENLSMETFLNCPIEKLELEDGIKRFGGYAAFWGATFKELTIPSSVEEIGEYSFHNNLEKVYFEGDAPKTGKQPFGTKATIYYKKGSKGWDNTELKEQYKLVAY